MSTILKDIQNSFVSIIKGLRITAINWSFTRPCVTELYPEQKPVLPEAYRGMPALPVDFETHRSECIACGACARMCPEQVITVVLDKTDPKDRKPSEFSIDISRCMFCGLCMEVCPKNCLKPARTFELACYSREQMVYNMNKLNELGGELPKEPEAQESESQP
ncbi:MAG: 4Fe-4S binding protein [Armatimonadota bacterium]|nr:4Fe-4S binding protein [bacterium]